MAKTKRISISKQKNGLIAAVRAQKCLYDPKNANFKANNGVWNQVATQCGIKRGQMAKMMWKNIYEAYNAYRKNPDKNINKTYAMIFKQMHFIDPYLIEHTEKEKSSDPDCKSNTEIKVEANEDIDESLNINETTTNGEFTTIQYWNESKDESKNDKELETNSTIQPIIPDCSEYPNADSDVESYEDIFLPDELTNGGGNSLKMFFDAMFASTSQLPQVLQRTVKRKVFSAVLEAEEEAEKQQHKGIIGSECIQAEKDL